MPGFRFRLQPVLDGKVQAKEAAEAALAEAQRELAAAQTTLEEFEEVERRITKDLQLARRQLQISDAVEGEKLLARAHFLPALKDKLTAAKADIIYQNVIIEQSQAHVETVRRTVADCTREVEILQKYRDKLQARFSRELTQKEESELDEIGNTLYLTRSRNA